MLTTAPGGSRDWCLGVVLAAVAALVGLGELTDVHVDLGLLVPLGMIAVGALLVAAAVLTGFGG